jgi:two-component system alkaline phosphatase synthesis response regulator PhoP
MLTKRILVVDDDRDAVRLMRSYLEKAGYQVLMAYNGETALHMLHRERPDLVLLDLMLPDRDGWEVTRMIRSDPTLAQTPIIMLTARVTDEDKIMGLELGADDYVTKPYNPREVVARVRARLRIEGGLPQAAQHKMLRAGELEMDIGRRRVTVDGQEISLTATEFELLRVLMEQAGFVLTRSDLIRQALGADYLGLERTLDSHIRNLRRKLEVAPARSVSIATIYGVGYRLETGD